MLRLSVVEGGRKAKNCGGGRGEEVAVVEVLRRCRSGLWR